MKKILLLFVLSGTFSLAFAQSPFNLIVEGGLNLSSFHQPNTDIVNSTTTQTTSFSNLTGFHFGLLAQFNIMDQVSLQSGFEYTVKGSNGQEYYSQTFGSGSTGYTATSSVNSVEKLQYFEIPLNILYNIPVKKTGKIFIGGGPYMAFGYKGTYSNSGSSTFPDPSTTGVNIVTPISESFNISYGNTSTNDVKSTDFGLNAIAGFAFKNGFLFSAGYGYGLTNISNGTTKTTNGVLKVSIGYSFF